MVKDQVSTAVERPAVRDSKLNKSHFLSLIAGASAGVVCSLVCSPLDVAKVTITILLNLSFDCWHFHVLNSLGSSSSARLIEAFKVFWYDWYVTKNNRRGRDKRLL